jgi:Trk-type K+ transport system membrane component
MSKNTKILVGVLTFLPFVSFIVNVWYFLRVFAELSHSSNAPDTTAFNGLASFAAVLGFTILLSIGLLIYYIVHAVNNKALTSDERLMWILLFIFISTIAFMIYWVLKIWQDKGQAIASNNTYLDSEI